MPARPGSLLATLKQAAAAVPANVNPPVTPAGFTWPQISVLLRLNPGEMGSFDYFSHEHPGGQ